jgi:ATP-binding cassette subfamily F protein 3
MFNFPGDMALGPIETFSGGERARLALALIVWQRPNLLLLDEPTNHLDLETREALTVALAQFEGTLILVSHDRHLLRATTEQFLIARGGRIAPFDGDLEDYRDWLLKGEPAAEPAPARLEPPARPRQRGPSASRKGLEARIRRLEDLIARLSAKASEIQTRLADVSLYQPQTRDALTALLQEQAHVAKDLGQLETEWLEKQAELERS